jgi:hypothetical protein
MNSMRKETERRQDAAGLAEDRRNPLPVTRQRCHRNRRAVALTVGAALMFAPAVATGKGYPYTVDKPPPNPTTRDLERMGIAYHKFAALGRCEQPGAGWDNTPRYRWARGVNWRHTGPRYLAGLGFYSGTYSAWKPKGYPWPPKATPEQIVITAERVRRDVGITAWGAWRCWR